MIKINISKDFDWKITLNKVLKSSIIVILSGILAVYSEQPEFLALIPVVEGLLNYLKHK